MNTAHTLLKSMLPALCLAVLQFFFLAGSPALAQDEADIALLDRTSKAFSSVVKKAGPAVVHVGVEKSAGRSGTQQFPFDLFNDPFFEHFFGPQFRRPETPQGPQRRGNRPFKQQAAGSGFIISADGYVLTNNHVVDGADSITVRLDDRREFKAKVVGSDPQTDVALLKIDGRNLPVLPLGDSDALEVGEWVIAIGSPFQLNQTVTVGVVSAKGRNRMGITDYENFIQTDAAINPGNSGGPLLNIRGEAVGMNTAIFSRSGGYMGIGFAIPINMAKNIEQQLRSTGKITRGWLGVMIQDVNEDLAKQFGTQNKRGALVSEVTPDSPAQRGGLLQGDIITSINGRAIDNVADLRNRIAETAPNTSVNLRILRNGQEKDLKLSIGEQPKDLNARIGAGGASTLDSMGLSLQDLTDPVARQFGYAKDQGVLIASVEPGSAAEAAGLAGGQLIEEVNRTRVRNTKELEQALSKNRGSKQVLLRVRVEGGSRYVVLQSE
ncbi:MAG: DegQ family serine endoprotease [bacterium]|nr:DegQ family serine endoprotease [bacterium]